MAGAIGPGDWIECIDASPDDWGDAVPLMVGALYFVNDVVAALFADGVVEAALLLRGFEACTKPGFERDAYHPRRFRPLGGQSESLTTAKPVKAPEPAEAHARR